MRGTRTLLALGAFSDTRLDGLATAAADAQLTLHPVRSATQATDWLNANPAHGMLLDMTDPGAEVAALEVRAAATHSTMPLLGLTPTVDDLGFAEAFNWGADDLIQSTSERALVTRLRNLPAEGPPPRSDGRGKALVADPDRGRRVVLGRVLRNAGYEVTFAEGGAEAVSHAVHQGADLVIANAELDSSPVQMVQRARQQGNGGMWILTCPPRQLQAMRNELMSLSNATAADGFSPSENILFLVNELRSGGRAEQRASARLLYGTTVWFRAAGRDDDDMGYTYNVSEGGLYLRTLAPPTEDLVWLELRPPRIERRVRLVGKVVWRRRFGPSERATVPPGFGVQIVDGASIDWKAWCDGYSAFATALG